MVSVASPAEKGVAAYIPHDSVRDIYIYIYDNLLINFGMSPET